MVERRALFVDFTRGTENRCSEYTGGEDEKVLYGLNRLAEELTGIFLWESRLVVKRSRPTKSRRTKIFCPVCQSQHTIRAWPNEFSDAPLAYKKIFSSQIYFRDRKLVYNTIRGRERASINREDVARMSLSHLFQFYHKLRRGVRSYLRNKIRRRIEIHTTLWSRTDLLCCS